MRLLLHVQLYLQVTKVANGYTQTFFKKISSEKPGTNKLNEDINTRYLLFVQAKYMFLLTHLPQVAGHNGNRISKN